MFTFQMKFMDTVQNKQRIRNAHPHSKLHWNSWNLKKKLLTEVSMEKKLLKE